ncbi:MAG: sodium:glutamate symporter, partial [Muribaculaceae bacterium]|nr:sodium:glutamate symporter [Muribaculaceae bacterium]
IAFIFGALPLTSRRSKNAGGTIGVLWTYSQAGMLLQWAVGGLLGILVLGKIWTLSPGFGITMPAGFCGGHGTAAAIGQAFSRYGYDDILTLAMTAATMGIVASVIIGLILVKWGTRKGYTAFLANFNQLPPELRTGLLPPEKRESMGDTSLSSISMDTLTFNLAIIAMIALGGYGLSKLVGLFLPGFELPVFSCAFVAGIIVKKVFDRTKVSDYVDNRSVGHLSGTFTDYLVAFGIASIKLSVVADFIVPILILLAVGLFVTLVYVMVVGRWLMKDFWFEKAVFTWGWFTGTMAMGIALLRVVDPKMNSRCLDNYALAYLFMAPVEILLVTFAPAAFIAGYGLWFSLTCLVLAVAMMFLAYFKGWHRK